MRKLLKRIDAALNDNQIEIAQALLHSAISSSPEKIEWKIHQALIYSQRQQVHLAIICLQAVLKTSPPIEMIYFQLGQLYLKIKKPQSAVTTFHQGLLHFPLSVKLLSEYILCAELLGLSQSNVLQQRAGLLLSLIKFNSLELVLLCYNILVLTHNEIGVVWQQGDYLYGWVVNIQTPQSTLIHAYSPQNNQTFIAHKATPELKTIGIGQGFNGFRLPIKDFHDQVELVTEHKRIRLFGSPMLTYSESDRLPTPYRFKKNKHSIHPAPDSKIDIVIPVYEDLSTLQSCITALLRTTQTNTPFHLVLINDCSPSASIVSYLQQCQSLPQCTLINHSYNLGFIASVNIGMQQHPWRDVVLLNSDTVVVNNWLNRLQQLAYSKEKVATVTPLSNYAEKFSYPRPFESNDLPCLKDINIIDKMAARVNQHHPIEVPTGNGFCFFIRRDCLKAVGYFNQTDLLRGYSEESEFCLRASKKGWTHLCATHVYVGHEGGQSFKQERTRLAYLNNELIKKKYPLYSESVYRFIIKDPLKFSRRRIMRGLLAQKSCDQLLVVNISLIDHPLVKEHLKSSVLSGKSVWVLSVIYDSSNTSLQLHAQTQDTSPLNYQCSTQIKELIADIKEIDPVSIDVHYDHFFPKVLETILAKLLRPLIVYPYDISLQQSLEKPWGKQIETIYCINQYATAQFSKANGKQIAFPDFFYQQKPQRAYSTYIAILNDIITIEQERMLYEITHDWQEKKLPLCFVVMGNSCFKYPLESSQKIIFTTLTLEDSQELRELCSHVFILPNTSDFMPADIALAIQHNFQLIAFSQPNTQETLVTQASVMMINAPANDFESIKKTFQHYAKKVNKS